MTAFTHVALRVEDLRSAEAYYVGLFGLEVVFREAPVDGTWKTFRSLDVWDRVGTPQPRMAMLAGGGFQLALGERDSVPHGGAVDHVGLAVESDYLGPVRERVVAEGCRIEAQRDELLAFIDRYGIQWELSSAEEPNQSNGQRRGLWIED